MEIRFLAFCVRKVYWLIGFCFGLFGFSSRSLAAKTVGKTPAFCCVIIFIVLATEAGAIDIHIPLAEFTRFDLSDFSDDQTNVGAINCISEDADGFIWIGGANGLARFDGHHVKVLRRDSNNENSLAGTSVRAIVFENRQVMWVATINGLSRIDLLNSQFENFSADNGKLPGNDVAAIGIYQDWLIVATTKGVTSINLATRAIEPLPVIERFPTDFLPETLFIWKDWLWLGSTNHGFLEVNLAINTIVRYSHEIENDASLPHNDIRSIYTEDGNLVWIGSLGGGLIRYERNQQRFTQYAEANDQLNIANTILHVTGDSSGNVWASSNQSGLWRIQPDLSSFQNFNHAPSIPTSLDSDKPRAVFEDTKGNFWIGSFTGMVNFFDQNKLKVQKIREKSDLQPGLPNKAVLSVLEFDNDKSKAWIGSEGGLTLLDLNSYHTTSFTTENSPLQSNAILATAFGPDGHLWIGTWAGGLYRFDHTNNQWQTYRHTEGSSQVATGKTIGSNYIWSLLNDGMGNLWIGTQQKGLWRYEFATGDFIHYPAEPENPTAVPWEFVRALAQDNHGNIWVGTQNGLALYQKETDDFKRFVHSKDEQSIIGDQINALEVDSRNRLWIGTRSKGISIFDIDSGEYHHVTSKQGLPVANVGGFVEDAQGLIWALTSSGLAVIHPDKLTVENTLTAGNGLTSTVYDRDAAGLFNDERLVIGGAEGLNLFHPALLRQITISPTPKITSIAVNFSNDENFLRHYLDENEPPLFLKHNENSITFEFSLGDYSNPKLNRYRYRLIGFDETWRMTKRTNVATYTNLSPGDYIFEVKGKRTSDQWGEATSQVFFSISPPPWRSFWAYCAYAIMVFIALKLLLEVHRMRTRSQIYRQLSIVDTLTSLPNRLALNEKVQEWITSETMFSLFVIDLDHFKAINDTWGHEAGDTVLKGFSKDLVNEFGDSATYGRWGGEEFVLMVANHPKSLLSDIARRILAAASLRQYQFDGHAISITVSVGYATLQQQEGFEKLFERADDALYKAKNSGRNKAISLDAISSKRRSHE